MVDAGFGGGGGGGEFGGACRCRCRCWRGGELVGSVFLALALLVISV